MRRPPDPIAIRANGICKRYQLGQRQTAYPTLRDALVGCASVLTDRLAGRGHKRASDASNEFWALQDVSFEIPRGEVVGIIGNNGAGKSTLLKIFARITEPTHGYGEVYGRLGSLLEVGTGFHQELTGRENIFLNGAILGMKRLEINVRFNEIVEFAEIGRFLDTAVKYYSSGMYLRLAFAVAAHLDPDILLVDEVLAVGDAAFQRKCLGKMDTVAKSGRTVLFVSHNLPAVEAMCHRVIWLHEGRIMEDGESGRVISKYLKEFYCGCTERSWDSPETAPGNHLVRLRRACVRPSCGTPRDPINVRSDFLLEFEYWNLWSGTHVNLNIHLTNDHGTLVFNVGPQEQPRPLPRGLFRDVCHIPGDLLNNGVHNVELVVQDKERVIHKQSDIVSFDVLDSPELRGTWYGRWDGVIRPLLKWTTEYIADTR
jgi:lipopolysaccharide transport system ATP-binding protein